MSDYIVITREMLALGLRGSKLLVYALVYGFSKDGDSDFHGSALYIANWCGISKPQALDILKELTAVGLLERNDSYGHPHYRVAGRKTDRSENRPEGSENRPEGSENRPLPPTTPLTDSIETSIETSIDTESTSRAREDDGKKAYGEKVRMTAAEYAKIVAKYGEQDTATIVQMLDDYLVDHPRKHYANHYRAAIGWPAQRLIEQRTAEQRLQNAKAAGQRAQGVQQAPEGFGRAAADAKRRLEEIFKKYE